MAGQDVNEQFLAQIGQALHDLRQPLNVIGLAATNARFRVATAMSQPSQQYIASKLCKIEEQVERARFVLEEVERLLRARGE